MKTKNSQQQTNQAPKPKVEASKPKSQGPPPIPAPRLVREGHEPPKPVLRQGK